MNAVLLVVRDAGQAANWHAELSEAGRWKMLPPARSFAEARQAITRHQPALLVSDLQLPDGVLADTVRGLRASPPRQSHVRVLALTGNAPNNLLLDALQAGADNMFETTQAAPGTLARHVAETLTGGANIAPWIAHHLMAHFDVQALEPKAQSVPTLVSPLSLTAEDRQLLRQLSSGHCLNALATHAGVAAGELASQVGCIYRKMQWELRAGNLQLA